MPRIEIRHIVWTVVVLVCGLLLSYMVMGEYGLLHLQDLRREHRQILEKSERLETENRRLAEELKRLKTDEDYLEQVIRDELNLVRPDELVFDFGAHPDPAKQ